MHRVAETRDVIKYWNWPNVHIREWRHGKATVLTCGGWWTTSTVEPSLSIWWSASMVLAGQQSQARHNCTSANVQTRQSQRDSASWKIPDRPYISGKRHGNAASQQTFTSSSRLQDSGTMKSLMFLPVLMVVVAAEFGVSTYITDPNCIFCEHHPLRKHAGRHPSMWRATSTSKIKHTYVTLAHVRAYLLR